MFVGAFYPSWIKIERASAADHASRNLLVPAAKSNRGCTVSRRRLNIGVKHLACYAQSSEVVLATVARDGYLNT